MISFHSISRALGSITQTNIDISDEVGWTSEQIEQKTGISCRFISSLNETTESLAIQSVNNLDKNDLDDVDLLIGVTNTPSNTFPSFVHLLHSECNLKKNIQCIGINAGCSGFVDALEMAYSYIACGLSNSVLIVTSDTYQKFIRKDDRSIRTLFSDGSCATIIKRDLNGMKLINSIHSSHPNSYKFLELSGHLEDNFISMNGPQVLSFSLKVIREILEVIPNADVAIFPHQAGKIVLGNLEKQIRSTPSIKLINNYKNYGNLVSSSIPNLLYENIDELKNSKFNIFSGFGVGLKHTSLVFQNLCI